MLHVIFNSSRPLHPTDPVKLRIDAKKKLWDHFHSILEELRFAQYNIDELVDQVISDSIDHLHPYFSGPEIFNEVQTACITFMLRHPEKLESTFTASYFHRVVNKIKSHGKSTKDNPEEG